VGQGDIDMVFDGGGFGSGGDGYDDVEEEPSHAGSDDCGQNPAPPCGVNKVHHPTINGQPFFSSWFVRFTDNFPFSGTVCDEHGNDLPPDTPPPPRPSDHGPDDWTPYNNQVEFEVADFLYRRNQMSGGDIDFILNLWAASLAEHGDLPPFSSHDDMYGTIDSTPLGAPPWESFSLQYNDILPDDAPSWMTSEYDVWFRNPRLLVHHILSNPDFDGEINYAPVQEYSSAGVHRFQSFMSGDWRWKQAVMSHCNTSFHISDHPIHRT
jgi:hypothetical protein